MERVYQFLIGLVPINWFEGLRVVRAKRLEIGLAAFVTRWWRRCFRPDEIGRLTDRLVEIESRLGELERALRVATTVRMEIRQPGSE